MRKLSRIARATAPDDPGIVRRAISARRNDLWARRPSPYTARPMTPDQSPAPSNPTASSAQAAALHAWFDAAPGPSRPLLVIAGPCVLEDDATNRLIGETVAAICADLRLPYVFKASFDKANRSSIRSPRGPGLRRGLDMIAAMRERLGVPATTDIHEPHHAEAVGKMVDLLQIPAFLCRQTDLLAAAAATGKAVNVKKGQFMSPAEMRNALEKLREGGATRSMLTERGTFFGYNRLVTDFIGVGDMIELGREFGAPTCYDATHSMQLPGGDKTSTGGRPDRCAQLARAAVAVGVDAIFLECHPEPARSSSDAATIQPLGAVRGILESLVRVRAALA
jgi:2-dehydro-3-deoxyphosphooctonate aldolase (KDO 8-P synthase)